MIAKKMEVDKSLAEKEATLNKSATMVKAYLEIDNLFVKPIEFQMLEQHEESSEFSFYSPLEKRIGSTSSTEEIEDAFFTHFK